MSRTWHGRAPIRTALTTLLLAPFNWAGRKLDELIAADPAAGDEQGMTHWSVAVAGIGVLVVVLCCLLFGHWILTGGVTEA